MTDEVRRALDIVIARTQHERYRELTAEENPDVEQRDAYRELVIRLARGEPPTEAPPPTVHYTDPTAPRPCGGCPSL